MKKGLLFMALLALGANAFSQTAKTIPYTMDFEEAAVFTSDGWTTEDANSDGSQWMIADATVDMCSGDTPDGLVFMLSDETGDNDWLFSPALSLESGKTYTLGFKYGTYEISAQPYTVSLEASIGASNASAGMTTSIVKHASYNNGSCTDATSSTTFTVTTTGTYYIGFHAFENTGQIPQFVDDFSVTEAGNPDGISNETMAKLSVYPNPANSNVTINNAKGATINLYNVVGELVYNKTNANANETIDVTGLVNGLYFVHAIENNQVITAQFQVIK